MVSVTSGGTATLRDGILLSDVLPGGLTVSALPTLTTTAADATLLYSADGGSTWTTFGTGVNAVALLLGTGDNTDGRIDTGGAVLSYNLSFDVTVPAGTLSGTTYTDDAELRYDSDGDGLVEDGGTPDEVLTDSVTTTVDPSGTFAVGPYSYPDGDAPTTPTYTVGAFTITRSGDTQTIASVPEGSAVSFRHTLGNSRNYDDTFTLTSTLAGLPAGSVSFYTVGAGNAPGTPITGPLAVAAGSTQDLFVVVTVPADFGTFTAPLEFEITATSTQTPAVSDTTTNTITAVSEAQAVNIGNNVGGTPSEAPRNFPASPSGTALIPLSVTNTGVYPETFGLELSGTLPNGFTTTIYKDVDCDGVIDAGTDLPLTTGETDTLAPGTEQCLIVEVQVPAGAAPATYDVTASATSQTDPTVSDTITDTVTVQLVEGFTFVQNQSATTSPTVPVVYEHTLTNNTNQDALVTIEFPITLASQPGWTYAYSLVDPNNQAFVGFTPSLDPFTVAANGGQQLLYVQVTPDPNAQEGDVDTLTLTATVTYGGVAAVQLAPFVTDTTTVDLDVYGQLELAKVVSVEGAPATDQPTQAESGDTLAYTITGTNVGNGAISSVQISDVIPANTSYAPGSLEVVTTGFSGAVLYSTDGGSSWTTNEPTALGTGDTFAVGVDTASPNNVIGAEDAIPAGGVVTITFSVTIN